MEKIEKIEKIEKKVKSLKLGLTHFYKASDSIEIEIGIDEVGRGPMFGRVYSAAVILPKSDDKFRFDLLKDSKKFTNEKKIQEVAKYIKENAVAWAVGFEDEKVIDAINIRQATFNAMHTAVSNILVKMEDKQDKQDKQDYYLLVDGNDFKPYIQMNDASEMLEQINHILVEGGDNKYCSIAAASIIAKVERDQYIRDLCADHAMLDERYGLLKNKGYGTAKHMDGIRAHGITEWHRKSFGICRDMYVQA